MSSLLRTSMRVSRARPFSLAFTSPPRRFASSDYGSEQGGQAQGVNQKNPMKHLEHPGPESPAATGQTNSSSDSSSDSKSGAQPKIHQPKSPKEDESADVKKHNEEMANRADKSVNQLSEDDNKVDKKFWKGN